MKVTCAVCQTFVDFGEDPEQRPPIPFVCEACQATAVPLPLVSPRVRSVPPPPPPARPGRGPSMQLDFDDDDRGAASSDRAQEVVGPISTEPVSLRDLEIMLAPGKDPPPLDETPLALPPVEVRPMVHHDIPEPRRSGTDLNASDLETMSALCPTPLAKPVAWTPPDATGYRGSRDAFLPAPRDSSAEDLRMMEALGALPVATTTLPSPVAPAVQAPLRARRRPPKPPRAAEPEQDRESRPPDSFPQDSKMTDLKQMVSMHPASRPSDQRESNADSEVLNLSGDLFSSNPSTSAPPASERRGARSAAASPSRRRPQREPTATTAAPVAASPTPGTARSWGWAAAILAACAVAWLASRPGAAGRASVPAPEPVTTSEPSSPPTAAPAPTVVDIDLDDEPSIDDGMKVPTTAPRPTGAGVVAPVATTTGGATVATSPTAPASPTSQGGSPSLPATSTTAPPGPSTAQASDIPALPQGPTFDKAAASTALAGAAAAAAACRSPDDPSGQARVSVTFAPSGRVTSAIVSGPPFAGTPTGGCIAKAFRAASVPPFEGEAVTVHRSVTVQ